MLTGRCLCGGVRYEIRAAPLVMYHCHCAQCRHASGASFATNFLVRTPDLALTAGEELVGSFESSPGKRRHFCSRCGSPLFSASRETPGIRSIRSGTLDVDPGLRPSAHIWVDAKAPWTAIRDDLPQKPGNLVDR